MGSVREILEENNIHYRNSGKDYTVQCLNPEHEDNDPSLRIDKFTGLFNCFSCHFSGDIFTHFGVHNVAYLDMKVQGVKDQINELMWSRPIQIPADAVYFKSDYRYIKGSTYEAFNAFTTDSLDSMEGRLVIPVTDIHDNIMCLNGRYLYSDLDPRYKFYPSEASVPLFPAKPETVNSSIILVEGIFDLLNLYDKGLPNAVCVFGTSFGSVRKRQKRANNLDRLLPYKLQGVTTVYILFDGDDAGRSAANGLKDYISEMFRVEIISLEDGIDPGALTSEDVNRLRIKLYE